MGDKTIGALEAKPQILDTDLIALDDGQNTYKITGAQLRSFLRVNSLPMGTVIYNPTDNQNDMPGYLKGWTGIYEAGCSSKYPNFYTWIKNHPEKCVTKSQYDALLEADGKVNFYVVDEVVGSVRFPIYPKPLGKAYPDWANKQAWTNNMVVPFDCFVYAGAPQMDTHHYWFITPVGGTEFQLVYPGYSNDGPDNITVRLNKGDKLRTNTTASVNGWICPVIYKESEEYPWIAVYNYTVPSSIWDASKYANLEGKPKMNGVEIDGDKIASDYHLAPINDAGKVPESYLPSFVDDVVELLRISDSAPTSAVEGDLYFAPTAGLIYKYISGEWTEDAAPEKGKIYIALNSNKSYRWGGSAMVEISSGAAADITPITATSGSVSLEANKAYKMTEQGDITITLPTVETLDTDKVNKTNLHLRNEKISLAIAFPGVIMFKDGKDFSAIAPGHYYICFEYNSLAERWEADIKQQKFSGATVRKVADFSSEIPAGYVVSHVAFDGAALETAANNTAELVFPLQDTPYDPAFQRMQWPMRSDIRYKIKMPSARKILSYSVTGWAENGSLTDRILKSFRVWAAATDVDITDSNWKDNCKLIDEQINAFTSSDHNVTKKFAVALDVDAVCLIIEPTASQGGPYVCLGQVRFFGE